MIRLHDNIRHPNILAKKWYEFLFAVRQSLKKVVEISDGDFPYTFSCENLREYSRCVKMFAKEPGTCEWISEEMKPGQTFYDIGANIGVYTILAAYHVGDAGKVFAFEPHSANFSSLLNNIVLNKLTRIVCPCNFALHDKQGFLRFDYSSAEAGQSGSQLAPDPKKLDGQDSTEISELKYAVSVDTLIASQEFPKPHHVKIDVDGNELPILRGMSGLLDSPEHPISIQVEISPSREADILSFFASHRYIRAKTHYTRAVSKRMTRGKELGDYNFNEIFKFDG
jgi:FkbM family methyltransferase